MDDGANPRKFRIVDRRVYEENVVGDGTNVDLENVLSQGGSTFSKVYYIRERGGGSGRGEIL